MILLSFDVGIKNLAYCLLSMNEAETETEAGAQVDGKNFIEIIKWNIIDLSCDHVEETEEAKIFGIVNLFERLANAKKRQRIARIQIQCYQKM